MPTVKHVGRNLEPGFSNNLRKLYRFVTVCFVLSYDYDSPTLLVAYCILSAFLSNKLCTENGKLSIMHR